jgi:SAM-dependent methyltransferase
MSEASTEEFWQSLYTQGRTGWDLGGPTPVFRRLAQSGRFAPGKMIVVGAGRGYDARLFARHGFQVMAVDFAPAAIRELRARDDPEAPVAIVKADIFDLNPIHLGRFDYVLEYTFYCAIEPQQRPAYADVAADLLKPGGHFIGLIFPLDDHGGGPPFAVSTDELVDLLVERGLVLQERAFPADSIPGRRGREELVIVQKPARQKPAQAGAGPDGGQA